jgi:predicted GNAT family N-acyltransferase
MSRFFQFKIRRDDWNEDGDILRAILQELMLVARETGVGSVELSAQTHAIGLYRRYRFQVVSGEYLDAGLPHRKTTASGTANSEVP